MFIVIHWSQNKGFEQVEPDKLNEIKRENQKNLKTKGIVYTIPIKSMRVSKKYLKTREKGDVY